MILSEKSAHFPTSLRTLPKRELLDRTRHLAEEERRIGVELLWHLREIERRRVAEELGFSGIFDYCIKVLKFSEGSAYRRVQAMRALQSSPDMADALRDGRLNVTNASQIQTFIQRAKRAGISEKEIQERMARSTPVKSPAPPETGLNIGQASTSNELLAPASSNSSAPSHSNLFRALEGLSSREVERRLAELAPEMPRVERERQISESEIEVRVTISNQTRTKWNRIQELAAHRLRFDTSNRRLIELTTDVTLETLEKGKGLEHSSEIRICKSDDSFSSSSRIVGTAPNQTSNPRTIPAEIRRSVWRRDQGRCTYHDPKSEKRCENRFGLEIDHVRPWSLGGSSLDPENLRLLCTAHHRMFTERSFSSAFSNTGASTVPLRK